MSEGFSKWLKREGKKKKKLLLKTEEESNFSST